MSSGLLDMGVRAEGSLGERPLPPSWRDLGVHIGMLGYSGSQAPRGAVGRKGRSF